MMYIHISVLADYFYYLYRYMTIPELIQRLQQVNSSYRSIQKRFNRLKDKIVAETKLKEVSLDEESELMFMKLHHHLMLWIIWHNCHKIPSCISSGNSSWKQPANAKQPGSVGIHCLFTGACISDTGKARICIWCPNTYVL